MQVICNGFLKSRSVEEGEIKIEVRKVQINELNKKIRVGERVARRLNTISWTFPLQREVRWRERENETERDKRGGESRIRGVFRQE
jgi:hypothetical protein